MAIKHLVRLDTRCLGILGSGFQDGLHAQDAAAVREYDRGKVYSKTTYHRDTFSEEISDYMQETDENLTFSRS